MLQPPIHLNTILLTVLKSHLAPSGSYPPGNSWGTRFYGSKVDLTQLAFLKQVPLYQEYKINNSSQHTLQFALKGKELRDTHPQHNFAYRKEKGLEGETAPTILKKVGRMIAY